MENKDVQVYPETKDTACQNVAITDTIETQSENETTEQYIQATTSVTDMPIQTEPPTDGTESQTDLVWVSRLSSSDVPPPAPHILDTELQHMEAQTTDIDEPPLPNEKVCQTDPVTIIIGDASFLVEKLKVYSEENQVEVTEETQPLNDYSSEHGEPSVQETYEENTPPKQQDSEYPTQQDYDELGCPQLPITSVQHPVCTKFSTMSQQSAPKSKQRNSPTASKVNHQGDTPTTVKAGTFSCPLCDHSSGDAASLYNHLHSTHDCPKTSGRKGRSRCDRTIIVADDGSKVTSLKYFNENKRRVIENTPKSNELNSWRKDIRNEENKPSKIGLRVNKTPAGLANDNKRVFVCQYCPKLFSKSSSLYVHMQNSHRFQPSKLALGRPSKGIGRAKLIQPQHASSSGIRVQNGSAHVVNTTPATSVPVSINESFDHEKQIPLVVTSEAGDSTANIKNQCEQVRFVYSDQVQQASHTENVCQPTTQVYTHSSTSPATYRMPESQAEHTRFVTCHRSQITGPVRIRGVQEAILNTIPGDSMLQPAGSGRGLERNTEVQTYTTEFSQQNNQVQHIMDGKQVPVVQLPHKQGNIIYGQHGEQTVQIQYESEVEQVHNYVPHQQVQEHVEVHKHNTEYIYVQQGGNMTSEQQAHNMLVPQHAVSYVQLQGPDNNVQYTMANPQIEGVGPVQQPQHIQLVQHGDRYVAVPVQPSNLQHVQGTIRDVHMLAQTETSTQSIKVEKHTHPTEDMVVEQLIPQPSEQHAPIHSTEYTIESQPIELTDASQSTEQPYLPPSYKQTQPEEQIIAQTTASKEPIIQKVVLQEKHILQHVVSLPSQSIPQKAASLPAQSIHQRVSPPPAQSIPQQVSPPPSLQLSCPGTADEDGDTALVVCEEPTDTQETKPIVSTQQPNHCQQKTYSTHITRTKTNEFLVPSRTSRSKTLRVGDCNNTGNTNARKRTTSFKQQTPLTKIARSEK